MLDITSTCIISKKCYCFGCLRSRAERQQWHHMTTEQQREVLRLIAGRKLRIKKMKQHKGE
ncbi:DUF1289 domain-containing protein [Psychrobacter glaciei]|uniref:DUF1289 domain-containing protein n=1 Tax=Psychrobacter glaciei TaxID=619771 RepID=UPI001D125A24|nr:DUF1289 domain-containing protein [Psychrobacter glaciei]